MKYQGSKRRLAKYIVPIMLKYRKKGQLWVEPFVGGANLIEWVSNPRIGYDIDSEVIRALNLIKDNPEQLPKNNQEFTKEDYVKARAKYKQGLSLTDIECFSLFAYSFGAKKADSWARSSSDRDYVRESYNSALKQSLKLQGCEFYCSDYAEIKLNEPAIIYCDIPYKGVTKYKKINFDYDRFYSWVDLMYHKGHTIFLSELDAPSNFKVVFEKELTYTLKATGNYNKNLERLYIYEGAL